MNEEVKLLIIKAGGIICSDMATGTIEKIDYLRFDAEKFAELIVKETLQVARAGIEYGDGMEDAVYKYFGVEE